MLLRPRLRLASKLPCELRVPQLQAPFGWTRSPFSAGALRIVQFGALLSVLQLGYHIFSSSRGPCDPSSAGERRVRRSNPSSSCDALNQWTYADV